MADWLRTLWQRLQAVVRRQRLDDDIRDELEFHLAMREAQLRASGTPDAGAAARRRFGSRSAIHDRTRDAWIAPWWQDIGQDVRVAARLLVRGRWFTVTAVLTLAVGIGINTAMYTVVGAVLVRDLPLRDADRVMLVGTRDDAGRRRGVSRPDYDDWQAQSRSFASLAASYADQSVNVGGGGEAAERLRSAFVTANLFATIGLTPALGRDFVVEDDQPGAEPVALIAHRVWHDRYGSDPAAVGQGLRANGRLTTIVGVMPPNVAFPNNVEIWFPSAQLPADIQADRLPAGAEPGRDFRIFQVFGRRHEDVSAEQADAEIRGISRRLSDDYPATNAGIAAFAEPLGETGTPVLSVLFGQATVLLVLLVACGNVASLLLVRAARRSREMAVRASLGAGRWRMTRQLLVESTLLASLAGAAGFGLAAAGVRWLAALVGDISVFGLTYAPTMDGTVFLFWAASGVVAAAAGMAPALVASRIDVNATLKEGSGGASASRRVRRSTAVLLVAELAMTFALLATAGLMTRSLLARYTVDLGVDTSRLLTMRISMVPPEYAAAERRAEVFRQLEDRLAGVPAIEAGAMTSAAPFTSFQRRALAMDGRENTAGEAAPRVATVLVGDAYFDVVGVGLLRGRPFSPADGRSGQETAIVNRAFAQAYFPDGDPLGRRLRLGGQNEPAVRADASWLTIVGVAPDIRQDDDFSAPVPLVYRPHRSEVPRTGDLLIRVRDGNPADVAPAVRDVLRDIDTDLAFFNVWSMDAYIADQRSESRVVAAVLGFFGVLAIGLSAVALYGVTTYAVAERTREIGLRIALGALPGQVTRLVLSLALRQLAIGLPLGLAGALAAGQLLRSELSGTSATDPVTMVTIAALLTGVSVLATLVPARRAARVDPMQALRHE